MSAPVESTARRREAIDTFAAVAMIVLTLSWGLNGVAAKIANQGYSPLFLSVARSVIGGVLVFAWCRWRGIELFARDRTLVPGIVAGLLFGLEFILLFVGLDYTSVGRSSLMINTMPFWVLIGGHFLLGERITLAKLGGLVLAFGGVVLVFSDQLSSPGPNAIVGDIMSLAAGLLWAATTFVIRRSTLAEAQPEKVLLYQLAVTAVMTAPLMLLAGPIIREFSVVPTTALLFQALYVVAFTYAFWFWLIGRYSASGLSSFVFLTPAFGVFCGSIILDEPMTMKMFMALGLIAAGLIVVNRRPAQAAGA